MIVAAAIGGAALVACVWFILALASRSDERAELEIGRSRNTCTVTFTPIIETPPTCVVTFVEDSADVPANRRLRLVRDEDVN